MNTENEQAVIGILLQYPETFFLVQEKVNLEVFKDPMNYRIYETITALNLKGLEVDIPMLISELNSKGLKNYGNYLVELESNAPVASNLKEYINKLLDSNIKDIASKSALALYDTVKDTTVPVEDTLSNHITELSNLLPTADCRADSTTTATRFLQDIENRRLEAANGNEFIGIPTGIHTFDKITRGLRKYSLITIAALSGSYKTYFALNLATNYAKQGKSVLYFSLEMSDVEMAHRIIPMAKPHGNTITSSDFYETKLSPEKQQHFDEAIQSYKNLNFIMDWGTRNLQKILLYAEKIKRSKAGLDLIVIDHIQLLEKTGDPFVLAEYTGALKSFALTNNIPIIILSQFNKQSGIGHDNPRPKRSWLKGSSSIEHDSDVIIFLHRENKDAPETTLILEKFRQSESAKTLEIPLRFDSFNNILKETVKIHNPKPEYKKDKYTQQVHDYTTGF